MRHSSKQAKIAASSIFAAKGRATDAPVVQKTVKEMSATSIRDALHGQDKIKWTAFKKFLDQSIDKGRYIIQADDLPESMVHATAEYAQERLTQSHEAFETSVDEARALRLQVDREADILQRSKT